MWAFHSYHCAHSNQRALVKFDVSNNMLLAQGARMLADALDGNQVMKELNISRNHFGCKDTGGQVTTNIQSGVIRMADTIWRMGSLSKLDISNNGINADGAKVLAKVLKRDWLFCNDGRPFKSRGLLASPTCKHCGCKKTAHTTAAFASLDLSHNYIPVKEMDPIKRICESKKIVLSY